VAALLRVADVFAFPSEYREGVPRVLCEAALAGVPTVTTSMPGCREVITDGVNGFVVPPSAPHFLAEKILAALDDPAAARAMAARTAERVRQEFSLKAIVAGHAALYRELVDRAGRLQTGARGTGRAHPSAPSARRNSEAF
jgi:glycosyltransferase involved in cell wall biosynthesis